jgi:predicted HTH transcriptional regulator
MDYIKRLIEKGIEGRRLEFKRELPENEKIAKTVIAFSNGAGGNLVLGIEDKTRNISGIGEDILLKTEEKIANIIYDTCFPSIMPEITVHSINDKYIINVRVYPGSQPPYYIKSKGRDKGSFIRIGSTNRLADKDYITRLERIRMNISFDEEIVYLNDIELNLDDFIKFYQDKTGKNIDKEKLHTLGLIKSERDKIYPTNAGILLQPKTERQNFFKYAHINCARFKGDNMDVILDQYTADETIYNQPEAVMKFLMRNIAKSSKVGLIYRENRWEYPLNAIREAVINAVIHRDYSITGSDIKVAVFDNRLEITSPGNLPTAFDILDIYNNPSEIRNKILAPIFKELNLIEQWGNGFKKIQREMSDYPEMELVVNDLSDHVQVQFIKTEQVSEQDSKKSGIQSGIQSEIQSGIQSDNESSLERLNRTKKDIIIMLVDKELSSSEITNLLNLKNRASVYNHHIKPLMELDIIEWVFKDKKQSRLQKYKLTEAGKKLAKEITRHNE